MTTEGNRVRAYRSWWKRNVVKYEAQYYAFAPVADVNPEKVDHLFSATVERGERHFGFRTKEARDAFVATNPSAGVCQDPSLSW